MDIYVEYDYYTDSNLYGGELIPDEKIFQKMAKEASVFLGFYTMKRITQPYSEDVQEATCAIAENIYTTLLMTRKKDAISEKGIQREDNDGYVVTYFTPAEISSGVSAAKRENAAIARRYLLHTGLLYRG